MNATRDRSAAVQPPCGRRYRLRHWLSAAVAALGLASTTPAQDATPDYAKWIIDGNLPPAGTGIQQVGCCGNDLPPTPMITGSPGPSVGNCPPGCNIGHCIPGQKCPSRYAGSHGGGCDEHDGHLSRCCNNLFECFCCPDHCYEPQWLPGANAGFWIDHARPQSQLLIRWDAGINMSLPDRNEFFWARIGGKGPKNAAAEFNYHQMTIYSETAVGGFGLFVEGPYYRLIENNANGFDAGWGDMNIGTKTMFVDCEMLQMTMQIRTWIPVGASLKGFGNGHVTIEPSLLTTLKVCHDTYLETQLAEWIPIAGDDTVAGLVMRYNASLNHVWLRKKAMQLVGTFESFGYAFQDGAFTLPTAAAAAPGVPGVPGLPGVPGVPGIPGVPGAGNENLRKSSREAYNYVGAGFRLVICDKFDWGVGAAFAISDDHFADQWYRSEIRIRY